MRRFLILSALAGAMLTLLAACGVGSSEDQSSGQGNTIRPTAIAAPNFSATNVPETPLSMDDATIIQYLTLMEALAIALGNTDTTDLSDGALEQVRAVTTQLEQFSGFFNALDAEQRDDIFDTYGVELRQAAERVVTTALVVQDLRGDEAISQELARLPAFAISGSGQGDIPARVGTPQVSQDNISALLSIEDVSAVAGTEGLLGQHVDLRALAADANPAQVQDIVSFDSLTFTTPDGSRGLVLTVIMLDSEETASQRLEFLIEERPDIQHLSEEIAEASGYFEGNQEGIGSMVFFKKGAWLVTLHTAQPDGVPPLMDLSGVETLARKVAYESRKSNGNSLHPTWKLLRSNKQGTGKFSSSS